MPMDIERSFLEQGNRVAEPLTCGILAERAAIAGISVPIAVARFSIGCGVATRDGVLQRYP